MNPNDKMKLKVLHRMFNDIDGMHDKALSAKFKKKPAVVAESVTVAPKGEGAMPDPTTGNMPPGNPMKPDMDDDDTRRLMELYQGIK